MTIFGWLSHLSPQRRTQMMEKRLVALLRETVPEEPVAVDLVTGCRRALVLAPHFDDEVISCGGTILRHRCRGQQVTVLYFTDGSAAEESGLSPAALTAVRTAEAAKSNALLDVQDQQYLGQRDGHLAATEELVAELTRRLPTYDLVYAPHETDAHPDHQAVYQILQAALERLPSLPAVAYYEFWKPLDPNCILDVNDLMATKIRALQEHASQLRFLDYVQLMTTMAEQRGRVIGVSYAEAFRLVRGNHREEVS